MRSTLRVLGAAALALACLPHAKAAPASAAGDTRAATPRATPASGPHVSPYARVARQHAQEAASTPRRPDPRMQRRPRMPASVRHG